LRSLLTKLDRWWYAPLPALRLATLRIFVGGFAWVYLLVRTSYFRSLAEQPERFFRPVGVLAWLPEPLCTGVLAGLITAALFAGAAFVLGARFRLAGPAFAALFLVVTTYGSCFGMVFHHENIVALQLFVLGFSASADARSLDARGRVTAAVEDGRHGWPVRLLCLLLVATYLLAGIAKLKGVGLEWLTGEALRDQIAYNGLRKLAFGGRLPFFTTFLVRHVGSCAPLAWATLAFELGAPLALLGRRAGLVWSGVAWGFHVAVLITMSISFFYPLTGIAFLSLFEAEKLDPRRLWVRLRKTWGD